MIGAAFAPIILVLFLVIFALSMCQGNVQTLPENSYNEEAFQDYADDQYALHFSSSGAYEDNLLIVVLTEENHSDFYYIAWVGDHIAPSINQLMGNNSTLLGQTMNSSINESNYKYSLDSNLADVMQTMTKAVTELELESSFTCTEDRGAATAKFVNSTELSMTESTVEAALQGFVDATGIPLVLVVEDAADVFEAVTNNSTATTDRNNFPAGAIVVVLIAVAIIVIIIVTRRKNKGDETDDRYKDFDN